MKITPLGDSALTVHVPAESASDPDGCLREVSAIFRGLQEANLPGVVEVAPAFTTVSVFFDPARLVDAGAPADDLIPWLSAKITARLAPMEPADLPARSIEIAVCYDTDFGPDLALVGARRGLSVRDVISVHVAAQYRVGCIGFVPGFPYLTGLPPNLATPRRATPRVQVAAGSVAIGGTQCGIYPQRCPGGWNVIGRTPCSLFDPRRDPPATLAWGDIVHFRPITRAEFEAFSE
ncbi:MAG TPA: 5-oxoprolinase subunit PxpB [Chthoniobacterales bacterium]|nr:5-oxoprolinase subunit PxpB [Chthoniobacterales bacterium]